MHLVIMVGAVNEIKKINIRYGIAYASSKSVSLR